MKYETRNWIGDVCGWYGRTALPTCVVQEQDKVIETGLVDASGTPLVRVKETIGFVKL